ncbi:hypothetical protein [Actinosynnema sp. NPDC020468]|uniref:hypothetical protein n=1 Tax=Actinosynnema sp. NPDC020468 TaxID=3154488 RepID=UPI0033C5D427
MRTLHRRFTLVGAAAALLVASGCGTGPSRVGTAMIIGDKVIPLEQVQDWTSTVLKEKPAAQQALQQHKLGDVARSVAGTIIRHELIATAAQREGVQVDEAAVSQAIEDAGGAEAASEATVYSASNFRTRAADQLLMVEIGRRHIDRTEVTFDYFYARDETEARDKAKDVAAHPEKMAEYVAAAPKGTDNQQLAAENQKVRSDEDPEFATLPVFGVAEGTVAAFQPRQESSVWMVTLLKERNTNARSTGESSSAALSPQILQFIGLRVVQSLTNDVKIEVNPRYGVWDPTLFYLSPSEKELAGFTAPTRQTKS